MSDLDDAKQAMARPGVEHDITEFVVAKALISIAESLESIAIQMQMSPTGSLPVEVVGR